MQFWLKTTVVVTLSGLAVGCSVFNTPAVNKKNYQATAGLEKIPAQTAIASNDYYKVKPNQFENTSVRFTSSPAQLLPVADKSWVEEGESEARIMFEKSEFHSNLNKALLQSFNNYLNERKIRLAKADSNKGEFITDWVTRTKTDGMWWWKSDNPIGKERFKYTLEMKPHQRQGSMMVQVIESEDNALSPVVLRELAVLELNRFVAQYDLDLRKLKIEEQAKRPNSLSIQKDNQGLLVLQSVEPYAAVWADLADWLEMLKFEVTDLNQSSGRYDVKYIPDEPTFWDKWWMDEEEDFSLPLSEGEYVIKVLDTEPGTRITVLDSKGKALNEEQMKRLLELVQRIVKQKKEVF